MAGVFTIDAVEGNSNIGVPVFSRYGKKANYNFLVFSPTRKDFRDENEYDPMLGG